MSKEFVSCFISCFYPTFPLPRILCFFCSVCRLVLEAGVVPQFQNALKREKKIFFK